MGPQLRIMVRCTATLAAGEPGGYSLAALRWSARQRMPASIKSSISPSSTDAALPTSCSVRKSLTI